LFAPTGLIGLIRKITRRIVTVTPRAFTTK
jgi:hypothetical protein